MKYFIAYFLCISMFFLAGCQTPYENGRDYGYGEGYNEGYDEGYDEGYSDGHLDGYEDANGDLLDYQEGYSDGYNEGTVEAYGQGYADALRGREYAFSSAYGVVFVPVGTNTFHSIDCTQMADNTKYDIFLTEEAIVLGYQYCKDCIGK